MPPNPKKIAPNIERKSRLVRGLAAAALFIGGLAVLKFSFLLSLALLGGGAFVLFEALRGWCASRACGIKTKF